MELTPFDDTPVPLGDTPTDGEDSELTPFDDIPVPLGDVDGLGDSNPHTGVGLPVGTMAASAAALALVLATRKRKKSDDKK